MNKNIIIRLGEFVVVASLFFSIGSVAKAADCTSLQNALTDCYNNPANTNPNINCAYEYNSVQQCNSGTAATCNTGMEAADGTCYYDITSYCAAVDDPDRCPSSGGGTTSQLSDWDQCMIDNNGSCAACASISGANTSVCPLSGSASGGDSGLVICANGIIGQVCRDANGNIVAGTPIVTGGGLTNTSSGGSGLPYGVGSSSNGSTGTYAPAGPKCTGNFTEVGGVCFPTTTGLSAAPVFVILSNLFSWLMGLFTTFAVMAFVISGIQYLTAAGEEGQIETAKRNAKYALIGIVVGLSGFVIIRAIVTALSGQGYIF